ncbi:MAG: hypothetical protein Q8Q09_21020 [Deltaproteobacteria bacterium]|nr:hypothetical protein [Deltaproteobacteria bacterium]
MFCLLLAVSAVSCRAFDRDEFRRLQIGQDAEVEDANVEADAAPEAGSCLVLQRRVSDSCTLAELPSVPAGLVDQASNGQTYALALTRLEIGPGSFGNWADFGFDRDGFCTLDNPMRAGTTCTGATIIEDGREGRDNSFGAVSGSGLQLTGIYSGVDITDHIGRGGLTLGIRITEWSGGDDGRVVLEWLSLARGRGPDGMGLPVPDARNRWAIESRLSSNPSGGSNVTSEGFVACGYVAARGPAALLLRLPSTRSVSRTLLRAVIVGGALRPDVGGYLDLSGSWPESDQGNSISALGICPSTDPDSPYQSSIAGLRRGSDIVGDFVNNGPTAARCNASSLVFRLHLRPIEIDGTMPGTLPLASPCDSPDAGARDR